jgi:hypothetical protein
MTVYGVRKPRPGYLIHSSSDDKHESYRFHLSENLKYTLFTLDLIKLNAFKKIIKNFFDNGVASTISTKHGVSGGHRHNPRCTSFSFSFSFSFHCLFLLLSFVSLSSLCSSSIYVRVKDVSNSDSTFE